MNAVLKSESLPDLLTEVDFALASVLTSASLDVYCVNLPVINFIDRKNLNFSPLRGYENANFVSSAEEILTFIADKKYKLINLKTDRYNFFWLDNNLTRWKKLIESTID